MVVLVGKWMGMGWDLGYRLVDEIDFTVGGTTPLFSPYFIEFYYKSRTWKKKKKEERHLFLFFLLVIVFLFL